MGLDMSVGCCALTTPQIKFLDFIFIEYQIIGVVMGQHPTRFYNSTL